MGFVGLFGGDEKWPASNTWPSSKVIKQWQTTGRRWSDTEGVSLLERYSLWTLTSKRSQMSGSFNHPIWPIQSSINHDGKTPMMANIANRPLLISATKLLAFFSGSCVRWCGKFRILTWKVNGEVCHVLVYQKSCAKRLRHQICWESETSSTHLPVLCVSYKVLGHHSCTPGSWRASSDPFVTIIVLPPLWWKPGTLAFQ